jgi:regulator of sigma E protease
VSRPISGGGFETVETDVKARWDAPDGQGPTGIQIGNLVGGSQICQTADLDQCKETNSTAARRRRQGLDIDHRRPRPGAKPGGIALLRRAGPQVAGPVGIADATGDVVKEAGWKVLLDFAALLSINLAIVNILPLPMLDGGRIVFVLIEIARRGRRIAPEKEAIVHLVGLAAMLTLAVVITYFDVLRLIDGRSLFD